jgi:hypothetical protein
MSIFQGGAGYQGNEGVLVPSGGGAFKYSSSFAPVEGNYAGACPGDPGCPGRETEYSGTTSWSDVGKSLALQASSALLTKYLSRQGTPSDRAPVTGSKGNLGSAVERLFGYGSYGTKTARGTVTGAEPAISPAVIAMVALVLLAGAVVLMKRRRV